VSNPLRTHVKNFLLYKFWEIGPSFINKYTVSVSIYERLAGVTSKLAQNEYTGPAIMRWASCGHGSCDHSNHAIIKFINFKFESRMFESQQVL
jgi:hypothetical protein